MEEEILPDKEPQKEDQDVIAELEESTLEEVQDDLYELEKTLGSIHTTRMTKPYM